MKKHNVKPEDFLKLKLVNQVDSSPDGDRFIYTLKRVDAKKNKYFTNLFLSSSDGSKISQFTHGDWNDVSPRWSPDGEWIVFLSDRKGKMDIYIIPTHGGGAKRITDLNGIITHVRWMPNSKSVLFSYCPADKKNDKEKNKQPLVRRIDRMYYKADGKGYRPQGKFHIYRVYVNSGRQKQITKGDWDDFFPTPSPDGKKIAFISNRHKDYEYNMQLIDIWIVDNQGKNLKKVKAPKGPKQALSWSPDAKYIAYTGHSHYDNYTGALNYYLWIVPMGKGNAKNLTQKFNRTVMNVCVDDIGETFGSLLPSWLEDSKQIIFGASDEGDHHLFIINTQNQKIEKITEDDTQVFDYSYNKKTQNILFSYSRPSSPANISIITIKDRKKIFTINPNKDLLKNLRIVKPEKITFRGTKGRKIHGWLLKPPGFRKNRKYPLIVEVHGGPHAQYPNSYFHEFQALAGAGYIVFYSNPHGSQGYGEKLAKELVNNWGKPDYRDIMKGLDEISKKRFIDKKRMGVTGGSYGGFMTNWIIGHTNIFKAACTQRCVSNLISMVGTSDGGFMMSREFQGPWWKNFDNYWEMSPIKFVKKMKTPLLIIHSESDMRTPIEQAEQLYIALKLQKRDTKFLRYPEESHGLSRGGRPDRRIHRLKNIIDWFDRYLKTNSK